MRSLGRAMTGLSVSAPRRPKIRTKVLPWKRSSSPSLSLSQGGPHAAATNGPSADAHSSSLIGVPGDLIGTSICSSEGKKYPGRLVREAWKVQVTSSSSWLLNLGP